MIIHHLPQHEAQVKQRYIGEKPSVQLWCYYLLVCRIALFSESETEDVVDEHGLTLRVLFFFFHLIGDMDWYFCVLLFSCWFKRPSRRVSYFPVIGRGAKQTPTRMFPSRMRGVMLVYIKWKYTSASRTSLVPFLY